MSTQKQTEKEKKIIIPPLHATLTTTVRALAPGVENPDRRKVKAENTLTGILEYEVSQTYPSVSWVGWGCGKNSTLGIPESSGYCLFDLL